MHFREHPLLNTPHLILVILREAMAGEATPADCLARLRGLLTQANEQPPYGDAEILERLELIARYLVEARLLAPAGDRRLAITPRGREALAAHPAGFDLADLMVYPEFARHIQARARARRAMDPRMPAYDAGYAAYRGGATPADNPYPLDTVDHLAWENGWFEALDEDTR
jgi:hypothetical protein